MAKGLFDGMQKVSEGKEVKKFNGERKKRSYLLTTETIKQIEELKLYVYPGYTREQIIEEAVKKLHKEKYLK